jgi:hypothetical protein
MMPEGLWRLLVALVPYVMRWLEKRGRRHLKRRK